MKKVYIFGGPSNSVIAASIIDRIPGMEVVGVVNDFVEPGTTFGKFKKISVVGDTAKLLAILKNDSDAFVFSSMAGSTDPRRSYDKLQELSELIPDNRWTGVVDPTAIVPFDYCKLGKSVFIGPLAQLSPNTEIGDFCMLMGNAFVGHDSILEDFVHVTSNAVIGASVCVGKGTHVGTNSVMRESVKIGEYCIIGSGSVVLKDVADGTVVVGNPAKFLKTREDCDYGRNSAHYIPMPSQNDNAKETQ